MGYDGFLPSSEIEASLAAMMASGMGGGTHALHHHAQATGHMTTLSAGLEGVRGSAGVSGLGTTSVHTTATIPQDRIPAGGR